MAHGIGALLGAARILRSRQDVAFVVVGTGAERAALEDQARREGLANVVFAGAVSKKEVREYWRLCDVAVVLLRDAPLFRHVIPSKMFEAMGMERPIILGVRGESEEILAESGAGVCIPPEHAESLARAIVELAGDRGRCAAFGLKGRRYASERFNRDVLAGRMLAELQRAAAEPGPTSGLRPLV
jgi:glycosyltransferase involved in cell wall biosynthesis